VLATVLVPALSSVPATAADADLFTVRAVAVDATAETAPAARDRAVAEGRRQAFKRLVDRLVPASDAARIPAPTDARTTTSPATRR